MIGKILELWKERVPLDTQRRTALLYSSRSEPQEVSLLVRSWPKEERVRRAFRISFKTLFPILLFFVPFAAMEPFFFMIWGSVVYIGILAVAGPLLFARYLGEEVSFFGADCTCPHCQAPGPLRPFVSTRFEPEMVVLCRGCGQTCTVRSPS